ncbi:MAG: glycine cleavage system aminomethyltransferase GcvT, partial [Candidatus Dadabacteria bacterium]
MSDDYASLKRTPLYEIQAGLGARFVPFAGWELPVQYRGLIAEHRTVREKAGLFDVSHMGEIFVSGPEAETALQYLTCNNVAKLVDGRAQYSAITTPEGGVVDDIIIYRFSSEHYMLCVNAANAEKDFNWLTSHNKFNAEFINRS